MINCARGYTRDEMIEIALRLAERARANRNAVLVPSTAWLAHRGILALAEQPSQRDMLKALCRNYREGKCSSITDSGCLTCNGEARHRGGAQARRNARHGGEECEAHDENCLLTCTPR
jgi:hypothetical protein